METMETGGGGAKTRALWVKSGAIILQTEKFSFISKGLTSGYFEPFIFIRNYFLAKTCAAKLDGRRRKDLVLWDKWEFISS